MPKAENAFNFAEEHHVKDHEHSFLTYKQVLPLPYLKYERYPFLRFVLNKLHLFYNFHKY